MGIPRIEIKNGKKVLVVHGSPFIMLSGEVHNSSASSVAYMEKIWEKADEWNLNSLLLPVYWELLEPEQGNFNFELVDNLIGQAREHHKKIGFLWFGSWKNAQCYYAPAWVKTDLETYYRGQVKKGHNFAVLENVHGLPYSTLSAFCEAAKQADAAAFAALMRHIRETDGEENTVVMVQVENETGLLGSARERSDEADVLFSGQVPEKLVKYLQEQGEALGEELRAVFCSTDNNGSWAEVFGDMAEEAFTAYYTASYVETVAKAGKDEYPLPMAVNCWLDKGQAPGRYPSGGPVAKVMDIWQCAAPHIDIIAPDIYVPYFCKICDTYVQKGNPLFIAECATHAYAAARALYAVAHYHAICYAPFGIENLGQPFSVMQGALFGMDTSDDMLKIPQNPQEYARVNEILTELLPILGNVYGTDALQGAISEAGESAVMDFGAYLFEVSFSSRQLMRKNGACMIIRMAENEFFLALFGCQLYVRSMNPDKPYTDYLAVEEGYVRNGMFMADRRLNGDEITLMAFEEPTLLRIQLFSYY